MIELLLGHALQFAGVVYMCWLGAGSSEQQAKRSARVHLAIAGAVVLALLAAAAWSRPLVPFVLVTLCIWMGVLPLAMPAQPRSESDQADLS
jgi:hypothetical protein